MLDAIDVVIDANFYALTFFKSQVIIASLNKHPAPKCPPTIPDKYV